ncbi:MAG: ABC transporter permease [Acidobacteriaceae bacterium]
MNTQSGAVQSLQATATMPVTIPAARRFYWAVRRELWEYRSLYLAPLAIAGLFLGAFLIGQLHDHLRGPDAIATSMQHPVPLQQSADYHVVIGPYTFAAYVLMAISLIVSVFYSLDTLYGERRDRSVLFWKSLPVSDVTTVLAKASIPLLFLPLFIFALTVVTQWIMLLLTSVITLARGESVAILWAHVPLFQMALMLFFHLVGIHGLQFASAYCWMLLVSAWARRAPFLWAVVPPVAIAVAEKIAFNTHYFLRLLGFLVGGGSDTVPFTEGRMEMAALTVGDVAEFFSYPGLWVGLVVAALLLAATVRMRRSRDPI